MPGITSQSKQTEVATACCYVPAGNWCYCHIHNIRQCLHEAHRALYRYLLLYLCQHNVTAAACCDPAVQVLSTPTDVLQSLVDKLISLGMDNSSVQQMLWEFPGLMAGFREEQLPLIVRMVESRKNKYTNGGTYID